MAKSNGSMTWKEDKATVVEYCEKNAEVIGEFSVLEFQDYLNEGDRLKSRQNSITKNIKAKMASMMRIHGVPTPFVSNQGKRESFTLTDDEAKANPIQVSVDEDGTLTMVMAPNAHALFTKYNGRNNDDGSAVKDTGWSDNLHALSAGFYENTLSNYIASVKDARSE